MHQTRKGQQWYCGMKMHIGVDSRTARWRPCQSQPHAVEVGAFVEQESHAATAGGRSTRILDARTGVQNEHRVHEAVVSNFAVRSDRADCARPARRD